MGVTEAAATLVFVKLVVGALASRNKSVLNYVAVSLFFAKGGFRCFLHKDIIILSFACKV